MASNGNNQAYKTPPPQLSATFVPNQQDNYVMPVVSPIPQRSMPEVPDQMQQTVARLELQSPKIPVPSDFSRQNQASLGPRALQPSPMTSPRISSRASPANSPPRQAREAKLVPLQSSSAAEAFFPYIKNPPPNIPVRADEVERILDSARQNVIHSSNPEMQVIWAQDALNYIDTSIENNARLADAGLGRAQTPDTEHRLRIDAVGIINFLSDQHHPKAEFLRGTWLEFGKFGCAVDKPQAYRCFSTAARNGYARAEYRLGMQFEETNEIEKALKHYDIGVKANDAASCYRMGMMYLLGQRGHAQDLRRGLDYIRYSADNADENAPQGAYIYGMLLARELLQAVIPDQLLPRDLASAKYYLEKAAYLGFAKAQTRVGTAYELQQLNCDFDPVYSLHYYQLAARQGEPEAEMAISKWFLSGSDGVFPKNEAVAYEYALRAATSGFPTAEFAMGYFNEIGIHVPSNLAEAKIWYGRAAEHGNEDAKGRITGISRSKTLSRKDHDGMALAKIKSVRGRPNPPQQNLQMPQVNTLQMPQINTYRNPSPAPMLHPQASTTSLPYRTTAYQNTSQPVSPNLRPSLPSGQISPRPPAANLVPPNNQYHHPSSPVGNVYGRPALSASPASPYTSRQSSLPQVPRATSQGLPPRLPNDRPGLTSPVGPSPSSTPLSNGPVPARKPIPANIGYSAPIDFAGADRRRIVSGPGKMGSAPGSPIQNGASLGRTAVSHSSGLATTSHPTMAGVSQSSSSGKTQGVPEAPLPPAKDTLTAQQPSKRPAKGPSTFAEMGIPQAKQDHDCIVM